MADRTARILATFTLRVEWEDDWDVDHLTEFDCYTPETLPERCEYAYVKGADGTVLAALGCIDANYDNDGDAYRLEIERELIAEALDTLSKS